MAPNMTAPHVYFTTPSRSLFSFPPGETPLAIPPPSGDPWIKSPFYISSSVYQAVLRPEVPITFASLYIAVVLCLNAYNKSRNWRPWWIARTRVFTPLVVIHNLSLALFSLATFLAMLRAISVSLPEMTSDVTPAHYADALCKINGPRGLGDAISYDVLKNTWGSRNALIKLASDLPDSTDVGRLWNEGLAFWGWTFYLSKFYEVLDTLVILARGKRSPTLQTYHHAGAMLCMWAGMRYMSPPIWLFVFLNSFIHTLMYVYFTLATLGVKVPKTVKQTLTTMQIAQFLTGAPYAAFHLFVQYDVPVTEVYKVISPIKSAASAVSSKIASVAHHAPASLSSAAASATASAGFGALVKRLLLRAAGDEGAAENVRDVFGQTVLAGANAAHSTASAAAASGSADVKNFIEETFHRTSLTKVNCIDTSGQSFAIWLNIIYLAPLTVLFLRFFVKAYVTGTLGKGKGGRRTSFARATADAVEAVNREADNAGKAVERRLSSQMHGTKDMAEEFRRDLRDMRNGKYTSPSSPSKQRAASNGTNNTSKPASGQQPATAAKDSQRLAPPEKAIEDDESDGEGADGDDAGHSGIDSTSASPEKAKKKRNKKKKNKNNNGGNSNATDKEHDAAHAGENGLASYADVVKEE